jgi:hypothetical protein
VEAGEKGDPSLDDVVGWLRQQRLEPPCDWWDRTCAALATADGWAQVDTIVAEALFDIVVACRHQLLRRPCSTCTDSRIGLARAWLRRVEGEQGAACVVTRVDAYPPHRRELGPDTRPVPAGAEDLAPFIWQRWDQVCPRWRRLAQTTEPSVEVLPTTTYELLQLLDETDQLWWACEDAAPQPVVVETPCLGNRVIGFREVESNFDAELEDVRGIGPNYARRLRDSGTSTIEELAMQEPRAISEVLSIGPSAAEAIWRDAVERARGRP